MKFASCIVFAICLGAAAAEVYFEEDFSGDWESRWVVSENKDDLGKFVVTAGINGDSSNVGLKTSQDAKFYGISAATKEFSNKEKNLLKNKDMRTESDELTHVYTLVVKPDNTFAVSIDGSEVESGKLVDGWKFLEPKEIDDPEDKKPSDWVDEAEMDDPEDKKPDGYDDIPAKIADPKATKPDDWDDESDGDWEAPQIDNPDYKGPWKAKRIANPAYKGVWAPKKIANPKFVDDKTIGQYDNFGWVGIDVWQVKSGTLFDNILITDSVDTAKEHAEKIKASQTKEKELKKVDDDAKAAKAEEDRKKAEEERKAKEAEEAAKKDESKDA